MPLQVINLELTKNYCSHFDTCDDVWCNHCLHICVRPMCVREETGFLSNLYLFLLYLLLTLLFILLRSQRANKPPM